MHSSLFIKYGGFTSIHALIENFYDKLVDSAIVGPHFENTNIETLIEHQTSFISSLLGGPTSFSDQHLASVHSNLAIKEQEWCEVITLLELSLVEFGMEQADADVIINKLVAKKGIFL